LNSSEKLLKTIAQKGKSCLKLLEPKKVASNAKSCSKVAEHNRDMPKAGCMLSTGAGRICSREATFCFVGILVGIVFADVISYA
jgi:hypothetical protein